MKKSKPELKVPENCRTSSPDLNPNHIFPTEVINAGYHQSSYKGGQVNQEFSSQPDCVMQPAELMQHRQPEARGATAAKMNLHHQLPDGRLPHPAETRRSDRREECCCWGCAPNRYESKSEQRDTARQDGEYNYQLQSEEELEPPLPLRSDDEWQHYSPFVPPHHHMHSYGLRHTTDIGCYFSAGQGQNSPNLGPRYPPQPRHYAEPCLHIQHRVNLQNCSMNDSMAQGSVSVNIPQFSIPPVGGVSQVSMMNLSRADAETHGRRRTIRLPDECRNIFITYSSDVSSEMIPFVDFLTNKGFRPAIDHLDNSTRSVNLNKWKDNYLNDPSNLIIIAISPKYKEDIEGSVVDSHGLHTKYIHSMMLQEFIQQCSLNFRFIPVLFLRASQKHVPSWLQNTRVYRWPRDADDLLLRLLREERYVPPPVPVELSLIIKPVASSASAGQ